MKTGETANRLGRVGEPDPDGVTWPGLSQTGTRLIHQYDRIDRDVTRATSTTSLPELRTALATRFTQAESSLPS
ncbi:MAG: hypothetical protein ACRDRN_18700 [Sciscionella sp.]